MNNQEIAVAVVRIAALRNESATTRRIAHRALASGDRPTWIEWQGRMRDLDEEVFALSLELDRARRIAARV